MHLRFIVWFCEWTHILQTWPASCPCHQDRFKKGIKNDCQNKGRLLAIAGAYIKDTFDGVIAEVEEWSPGHWECSFDELAYLQGCVRFSVSMGREMFGFVDTIPYLFSRLDQPGVAKLCLSQFASKPESDHHRDSIAMLSPTQPSLLSFVLQIKDDGTGVPPVVQKEI